MIMSWRPVSSRMISTMGRRRLLRSRSPVVGKRRPMDTTVCMVLSASRMSSAL